MRVAVSADDNQGLEGMISAHFGRCPYYTLVDIEDRKVGMIKVVENPFYYSHGNSGEVPNFIRSQGASVMIAGGMGPKAINFFREFGIEVVTGASGRVRDAINSYLDGSLSGSQSCHDGGYQHERESQWHRDEEPASLRDEAAALQKQLAEVQERIARLGQG